MNVELLFSPLALVIADADYAIYPLLWIPIAALGGLIISGIIGLASTPTEKTTGKSLGVLGMSAAGKTTFLSKLGLVSQNAHYDATGQEVYEAKQIKIGERKLLIDKGMDIGGTEVWGKKYTEDWLINKDIVIFIFDGNKFLTDKDYNKETRGRLSFIYRHWKRKNEFTLNNVVIIASHSDEFRGGSEQMLKKILEQLASRRYYPLFEKNFFGCDLTNDEYVMKIANKIF